jgi:succinyl-CoA synthetase beta subunit
MLSAQGGVEIESVADSDPDAISKIHINPVDGLTDEQCRAWVAAAKLDPTVTDQTVDLLAKLYRAYVEGDADLVEINPLIVTPAGKVHALDAKVSLDNNAAFRHEWAEYEATQERDDREEAAHTADLQYVGLDGSVGIIANGAGLAMSTLDVVNQVGGTAANFLDVGGGADAKKFVSALTIIDNDPRVRSIFINIFGGITRGEEVANGIIGALGQIDIKSPIVIRLDGTNADEGRAILEPHLGDKLQMSPTMLDAARTAVALAAK